MVANASVDIGPYSPFRSLWVDASITLPTANQNGSQLAPYKTIQQAINAVPAAATAAEMQAGPWEIHIINGTYDEDLSIVLTARQWFFVCHGCVNLGTFTTAGWLPSGTRRNVTITGNGTADPALGTIQPFLTIVSDTPTTTAYSANGFRVSGKIDASAVTSTSSWRLSFQYVRIFSTDGTTTGDSLLAAPAFGAANNCVLALSACVFGGKITGNINLISSPILLANGSTFLGALSIRRLGGGFSHFFLDAVTCNVADSSVGGLMCCVVTAATWTITGGGSFVVDDTTFRGIRAAGVTLGAATTWSLYSNAANERLSFGGTVVLANDKLVGNGKAADVVVVALNPTSELAVDQDTILTKFSWNTATGNNTTVMRIYKNGVSTGNTTLSAVKGSIAINISVAAGDLISVDYASGTVPGAMTCSVST